MEIENMAKQVKAASILLAAASEDLKNNALLSIAKALLDRREEILKANRTDLEEAEKDNLSAPLIKKIEV